jgi:membrane-anchored protein YejM (alkaline phosphatase superfamily)
MFVDFVLNRVMPKYISEAIGIEEALIGIQRINYARYLEKIMPLKNYTETSATSALRLFKIALDDERQREANGNYIYMHLLLPHEPFNLNKDCNYVEHKDEIKSYLDQSQCALKLVDDFIGTLVSEGKLNNSLVIIHADHGYYVIKNNGVYNFEKDLFINEK